MKHSRVLLMALFNIRGHPQVGTTIKNEENCVNEKVAFGWLERPEAENPETLLMLSPKDVEVVRRKFYQLSQNRKGFIEKLFSKKREKAAQELIRQQE